MPIKFFSPVIPTDVAIKGLENEFNTFEHKEEVEYIQKIGTIQFTENYQGEIPEKDYQGVKVGHQHDTIKTNNW